MPCLQALPASLEVQIAKKVQGWWYVCGFSRDVPVREGTGWKQGWWAYCMSLGNSGEWETGKPLGAI